MATVQDIIKSYSAEELPKIAERVAQWEEKIKQFRTSCAQVVECPPGGEAYDVLLVADSSFALVKGHDTGNPTKFIASEICHPTARIREYHGRLHWGKGLHQIIDGISAGLDEIEESCRGSTKLLSIRPKPTGRSRANGAIVNVQKLTHVLIDWEISGSLTRELLTS